MDNVVEFPQGDYGVDFIGPFPEPHYVTLGGYQVPHITVTPQEGTDEVELIVDRRFSVSAPKAEVQKWMFVLANAMAVAAGYSCHGENCQPMNPYKVKMTSL